MIISFIKGGGDSSPPEWAGKVVAMIEHNGHVFIACERAVFCQYESRGPFQALGFVVTEAPAKPE